ncbi:hypothetical protein ACS0TY_035482 [Phlomoides rotata]
MLLRGMEFDTTHFITDVSGKYPRLWALKGAHPVTVNRWYKFGVLASIRTVAPSFREISELPDWKKKSSRSRHEENRPPTALFYQLVPIIGGGRPSLLSYKRKAQSSEEEHRENI